MMVINPMTCSVEKAVAYLQAINVCLYEIRLIPPCPLREALSDILQPDMCPVRVSTSANVPLLNII